jgi:NAD(P)-dependent dehydrogenase (short-subunit alcohol dehydrogenase family)
MYPAVDERSDQFSSHYVLVGGAGGIGSACVKDLLLHGHRVSVIDRDESALERLRSQVPMDRCRLVHGDALAQSEVDSLMAEVSREWPVDGLAYLVSWAEFGPIRDVSIESFDRMLSINVTMQMIWARSFMEQLGGREGSVVLIGSIFGRGSSAGRVAYSSVRGALVQLVRGLAVEWAPAGVRVNAIAPGWTDTPPFRATFSDVTPFERRTPFGRLGKAEDMAGPVRFLLGKDSRWVTGVTLVADGGVTAFLGTGDPESAWPGSSPASHGEAP